MTQISDDLNYAKLKKNTDFSTYIFQNKSVFWPPTNDDLIIIQSFFETIIHVINEGCSRMLCPNSRPLHLKDSKLTLGPKGKLS